MSGEVYKGPLVPPEQTVPDSLPQEINPETPCGKTQQTKENGE